MKSCVDFLLKDGRFLNHTSNLYQTLKKPFDILTWEYHLLVFLCYFAYIHLTLIFKPKGKTLKVTVIINMWFGDDFIC